MGQNTWGLDEEEEEEGEEDRDSSGEEEEKGTKTQKEKDKGSQTADLIIIGELLHSLYYLIHLSHLKVHFKFSFYAFKNKQT